jgi:periplasmic protein TonB
MTTRPVHLFDPAQAGLTGKPARAIRLSPTTQNDVFLRALLDTPTTKALRRSPLEWAAATALHIAIIATLIVVPLYTTGTIQVDKYIDTPLVAPPAAPPPPPPAAGRVAAPHASPTRAKLAYTPGRLTAPPSIPKKVSLDNTDAAPDLEGVVGGVPGGVPGGQLGGTVGGVFGGTGTSVPIPAPHPPSTKRIVRVGSSLKAPRQTNLVQPVYPTLAREAHVFGTVVVNAVIDEHGNVVQARALSGHPLLIQAALNAVLQWRYEPTTMNGTPVAVEMEVTVHFNLGN